MTTRYFGKEEMELREKMAEIKRRPMEKDVIEAIKAQLASRRFGPDEVIVDKRDLERWGL